MAHDIVLRSPTGFSIQLSTISTGAVISYFNAKLIELVDAINGISRTLTGQYNGIDLPAVAADSISLSTTSLNFTSAGGVDNTITVTSSGGWTASIISDPDNMILSFNSAGDDQNTAWIEADTNPNTTNKTATIRYTCGTATVDLSICEDGTIETCG